MKLYSSSSCLFALLSFLVSGAPIFASSQASTASTITDLALADPDLTSLVDLVVMLGLADDLAGAGPFTVFAPTNAAFAAIAGAAGTMDTAALKRVVEYHVIVGEAIPRNGFVTGVEYPLNRVPLPIASGNLSNRVFIGGGGAKITGKSIVASNGIIHKVDKVLLPPAAVPATVMNGGTAGSLEADEIEGPEMVDEESDEGSEVVDDEEEPDDKMKDNDED